MSDLDDRLVGDPVWELFPTTVQETPKAPTWPRYVLTAGVAALSLAWFQPGVPLAVGFCVAWDDLVRTRWAYRFIPDRDAARVAALFNFGWALAKWSFAGFITSFGFVPLVVNMPKPGEPPLGFIAGFIQAFLGFPASAVVTAAGLAVAWRRGLRVWVGEGVNQARTLLMGMLIVAFVVVVLFPLLIAMVPAPPAGAVRPFPWSFAAMMGVMFVGPFILLLALDAVSKRVIADAPTKFGAKVPALTKVKT